jgi:hypothetical protein
MGPCLRRDDAETHFPFAIFSAPARRHRTAGAGRGHRNRSMRRTSSPVGMRGGVAVDAGEFAQNVRARWTARQNPGSVTFSNGNPNHHGFRVLTPSNPKREEN